MVVEMEQEDDHRIDHRTLPWNPRRTFGHQLAHEAIQSNFLKTVSPLLGKEFPLMFRMSRGRFQVLLEDVKNTPDTSVLSQATRSVWKSHCFRGGKTTASFEDSCLSCSSPHLHRFLSDVKRDGKDCCRAFDRAIQTLYMEEYLRVSKTSKGSTSYISTGMEFQG